MSAEKVEDCKNCSGRGHHITTHTIVDKLKVTIVEIQIDCEACRGLGYIIK